MTKGKANAFGDLSSLRMITFNLDGLNTHNLIKRTILQLKVVMSYKPLLLSFQEVIPETAVLIYDCLVGLPSEDQPTPVSGAYVCSDKPEDWMSGRLGPYFTLTFVKKELEPVCFFERLPFSRLFLNNNEENFAGFSHEYTTISGNSYQFRDLLVTTFLTREVVTEDQAGQSGAEPGWRWSLVPFINCHLESTGTCLKSVESFKRMAQLLQGLEYLRDSHAFSAEVSQRIQQIEAKKNQRPSHSINSHGPGVLSGDLNIRNEEAQHVLTRLELSSGSVQFVDVAEQLETPEVVKKKKSGAEERKFKSTWFMPGKSFINARYDRVFVHSYKNQLECCHYEIFGEENYFNHGPYFTLSDHRGILLDFTFNGRGIPMVRLDSNPTTVLSSVSTSQAPTPSASSLPAQPRSAAPLPAAEIPKAKTKLAPQQNLFQAKKLSSQISSSAEENKQKRRKLFLDAYEKRTNSSENKDEEKEQDDEKKKEKVIEIIELE